MAEYSLDAFDQMLGSLHGLPDVEHTKPAALQTSVPITGASQTFFVQTYRQLGRDTIFLQVTNNSGTTRIAIPPAVADAIARQRDALTTKTRSKAAKANAQARKERGELPGFLRKRKECGLSRSRASRILWPMHSVGFKS